MVTANRSPSSSTSASTDRKEVDVPVDGFVPMARFQGSMVLFGHFGSSLNKPRDGKMGRGRTGSQRKAAKAAAQLPRRTVRRHRHTGPDVAPQRWHNSVVSRVLQTCPSVPASRTVDQSALPRLQRAGARPPPQVGSPWPG